jgi:membrane protease YdiL (CAAX protease family)
VAHIAEEDMERSRQRKTTNLTERVRQVEAYLRRAPGSRSLAYFGAAAVLLEVVAHVQDRTHPYALVRLHLATLPLGAALTYAFVRLRPEDQARWNRVPLRRGVMQALQGVGLGAGAFLAWAGIAAAKGWASAPAWGWEQTSISDVARSLALLGVGHLAVAWNEEMLFRGYGFETVREALGQRVAVGVLIPGFALYHGVDPQQLLGMAAGGAVLMLLRLQSDALWLPTGYHWAWNVLQTAVFGPSGDVPTVRPLQVHGPYLWVGRPGSPEPGLLNTLIHLTMALLVWLWIRRNHVRNGRMPAA